MLDSDSKFTTNEILERPMPSRGTYYADDNDVFLTVVNVFNYHRQRIIILRRQDIVVPYG